METLEEPLTKRQRQELEGVVALSTQVSRALLFLLFVAAVALLLRGIQLVFWQGFPLWLLLTGALSACLYVHSARWTGGSELRRRIRQDLAAGTVTISVVEPESVEEVEELEDEGPSYIVRTRDGSQYLLTGQEMARYKSRQFPWSKFGVIETPHSRQFLGLRRLGDPIAVTRTRQPFSYRQAEQLGCFKAEFIALDETRRQLLDAP